MPGRDGDVVLSSENEVKDSLDFEGKPEEIVVKDRKLEIVWISVFRLGLLHLMAVYGLFLLPSANPRSILWGLGLSIFSAIGVTAGAHRLWTHRTYRAKMPLRIFLAIMQTMASQNDIIEWSRDHRVHHKFSETDTDPHNAKRGFFFAHCGWLMCRKHPDVKDKGKLIDISDLLNDPVCIMQRKFYIPAAVFLSLIFPSVVPWYFWNESFWKAYFICGTFRCALVLNLVWNVNSVNHLWGMRPFDRNINPTENSLVVVTGLGEGYHNYHHTFPSDYSCSEIGGVFNVTTKFIDLMARLGQVEGRKTISPELVKRRRERTGDGSLGFRYL